MLIRTPSRTYGGIQVPSVDRVEREKESEVLPGTGKRCGQECAFGELRAGLQVRPRKYVHNRTATADIDGEKSDTRR